MLGPTGLGQASREEMYGSDELHHFKADRKWKTDKRKGPGHDKIPQDKTLEIYFLHPDRKHHDLPKKPFKI